MKKIVFLLLLSICCLNSSICHATNWLVGPTHSFTMPGAVSGLVQNGDTVSIDAGVYTADVCKWNANNLLLRGVGGYAHLNANNTAYGQKGIWVIAGNNAVVRNIEFSHCHDQAGLDMNWAGIRQEGLNLTVSHCYFHDNDNGILAGTFNPSAIRIEFSEFDHNGYGDGYSHNLYINHVDSLIFRYNYSHHATAGHELKSRANVNLITYNRLSNEATGDASREIDLPNGGTAIVIGNVIEQGPNSQNSGIVGYGLEGLSNPTPHELYFINNTVVNDKSNGTFVSIQSGTSVYKAYNNIFAGNGTVFSGSASTIDTANNWKAGISSVGFVNAAGYDYHLISGSQAIDAGTSPGTTNVWYMLTPQFEYKHKADSVMRFPNGTGSQLDIGAYEFAITTGDVDEGSNPEDQIQFWSENGAITCATSLLEVKVKLFDLNGRELFSREIAQGVSQFSVRDITKGVYLIQAISGRQSLSRKILVQ